MDKRWSKPSQNVVNFKK